MKQQFKPFFKKSQRKSPIAIFLSGSGTNAEKILTYERLIEDKKNFRTVCLVTDCPQSSRTYEIAEKFSLPVVELSLKKFYQDNGLTVTSLATTKGRLIRRLWTQKMMNLLQPYKLDFGIFAGFIPLTNITEKLPCLNIHPGDLTYQRDGKRCLIGLHTLPIRHSLDERLDYMRSTVIIASNYQDKGAGMDEGVIIGLSKMVKIDLPCSYDQLNKNKAKLEEVLKKNQEKLKINGDWQTFPYAVEDFAKGIFALNKNHQLVIEINNKFLSCQYVEYDGQNNKNIIFKESL